MPVDTVHDRGKANPIPATFICAHTQGLALAQRYLHPAFSV